MRIGQHAPRALACNSAPYTARTMTRELFDSFWRAAAYCLHPKVIALSLAAARASSAALAAALGYFYWEPRSPACAPRSTSRPLLEPLFAWLRSIGAGNWASVLAPLVVVARRGAGHRRRHAAGRWRC